MQIEKSWKYEKHQKFTQNFTFQLYNFAVIHP